MSGTGSGPQAARASVQVSHVADFYRRYPGEIVTLYTRVEVDADLPGFTLRVTVPPGLVAAEFRAVDQPEGTLPLATWDDGTNKLSWDVERRPGDATRYEYEVEAQVAPTREERRLESRAAVSCDNEGWKCQDEETVTVAVFPQGRYVEHLPAIYREDDLMGRFLMIFESFWEPIERQIEGLSLYFDPRLTPAEFLPWLASWVDLLLDEAWPESRRRQLVLAATTLYRKRGTSQGLQEYLQIYTGGWAKIVEHCGHTLRLGPEARLGPGIALGLGEAPHTFTVSLRLPPLAIPEGQERDRQEAARRAKIAGIVEAEKPAHTAYDLRLEVEPELGPVANRPYEALSR